MGSRRPDALERDPGAAALTRAERERLAGLAVPGRRADWLVGRLAAKEVVARALQGACPAGALLPGAIEIASERSGRPRARLAPEADPLAGFSPGEWLPVDVSISHAGGHAFCAAARNAGPRRLGVDLERVEPRSRAFLDTFLTAAERGFVEGGGAAERDLRANAVWCAKEAVLKALGLGLTVDTLDLCCLPEPGRGAGPGGSAGWPLAPAGGEWQPFAAACSPSLVAGGGTIRGIWRPFPPFVAALAELP